MAMTLLPRILGIFSVRTGNPELLSVQCASLSRMIPLLYFVLVANTLGLAVTFLSKAPVALTVLIPLALIVTCVVRLAFWWRRRQVPFSAETAYRELQRTNRFAALLSLIFCAWAFALFPFGDAFEQADVAFFLAMSTITSMLCLIHLRSAVLTIAFIDGTAFVVFFATRGTLPLSLMAGSFLPVIVATVCILVIQNRDFVRLVHARTEARRKHYEQSRLLRMIDDMPVAVMTVDPETLRINYANETSKRLIEQIEHLLPITADNLLGTCIDAFHKHPQHQRSILADPANLPHNARIQLGPEVLELKVSAITDTDGGYIGPMLTWALVTKEVEAEKRIRNLAHYDTLTGLPNRTTFYEELDRCLVTPGSRASLLYIDLDGFKLVNDTRGHGIGDALLSMVAKRLEAVCSASATMIGRLGGDEFAVLLPHGNAQAAEDLARDIINALSSPFELVQGNIQIGASAGIALAPEHGAIGEALLSRADIALYAAKSAGKGHVRMFADSMERRVQERARLEGRLRAALTHGKGLFVFYQPIVAIETGAVTAREALVRWHEPSRGWISPAEFVPVAEQSGLIDALGDFVLETACREELTWEDNAKVAVNISAGQLGQGTLPERVLAALVVSGLPPSRLEIEITETALLDDERDVIGDLKRIRGLGVRVALDDFGTGYSSLAHLRAFPFDKIKVDGSFVKDAVDRPDCAAVVRAVADLGKRLGVTTVAEGVETQEQLERIRTEGCTEVQGYLFGRPAPSRHDAPLVDRIDREALRITAI